MESNGVSYFSLEINPFAGILRRNGGYFEAVVVAAFTGFAVEIGGQIIGVYPGDLGWKKGRIGFILHCTAFTGMLVSGSWRHDRCQMMLACPDV